MSRNDVLEEFNVAWRTSATEAMADEIVRLREQLAASKQVACPRWGTCFSHDCTCHPSAAGVTVTEAMVEAFSLAYRICEETHELTFSHNMGIKAGLTAAITAASEGASDAE